MLKLLEETLQFVELEEELWVPRLGAREATMFHPGYGLIPCPEKAPWTRIGGDSEHFLKVFFLLRTIREVCGLSKWKFKMAFAIRRPTPPPP